MLTQRYDWRYRKQTVNKQEATQYLARKPNFSFLLHLPCQPVSRKKPAEASCHIAVNFCQFHKNRITESSHVRNLLVPHEVTMQKGVRPVSCFPPPITAPPVKGSSLSMYKKYPVILSPSYVTIYNFKTKQEKMELHQSFHLWLKGFHDYLHFITERGQQKRLSSVSNERTDGTAALECYPEKYLEKNKLKNHRTSLNQPLHSLQ